MQVSVIITCAGKGKRSKLAQNKVLFPLDGQNSLQKCLDAFTRAGAKQIIVTSNKDDFEEISKICQGVATVVLGGETRTQSVKNALEKVEEEIVLIHDGARPFVTQEIIKDCIRGACDYGGVIPVVPTRDTIVFSDGEVVQDYLGKAELFMVQTPQAFKTKEIKKAYALAGNKPFNDDGEVYKNYIAPLHLVNGDYNNLKLTFAQDFVNRMVRFGTGFDCHQLAQNRRLILGGVQIPHDKGLLGHSDADVLTHAIMDAILSAAALGDIGKHFPDTDAQYKDADSMQLLKKVLELINKKGYKVDSVSATIMAEKPKLMPYMQKITQSLGVTLNLPLDKVGIGATTLEGLGFVGREEGICVNATAVLVGV